VYNYLKDELNKGATRQIYIKGISNLLTTRIAVAEQKVKFLLNILEEKKIVGEIIENVPQDESNIGFAIGDENTLPELWDYSLISVKYTVKEMEGTLALLGPVRMDYVKGIYVLERIAEKLEEIADKIVE
ncbi:MAG: HrcA family transcriptional regulator, partial [Caldisericaceae bacterium]